MTKFKTDKRPDGDFRKGNENSFFGKGLYSLVLRRFLFIHKISHLLTIPPEI
jgi:hypothetical protein